MAQKRRGRPKKPAKLKQSTRVVVLLTREQYADFAAIADSLETTAAELARSMVLERIAAAAKTS